MSGQKNHLQVLSMPIKTTLLIVATGLYFEVAVADGFKNTLLPYQSEL